ncbi:tyrosine-type recombinase/integrase [Deinococcus terrestris]|nr:tyrosine-type recombinase/integrase [Deinococcus terrestris]
MAPPLWGQRRAVPDEVREKQRRAAQARSVSGLPEGWMPPPPPAQAYEPLFPTRHGTPLSSRNVRREWALVLERARVDDREFHSIRASFITSALVSRVLSLKDLQEVVGHTSPLMTLRYAQRSQERQAQVIQVAKEQMGLT